MCAIYIWTRIGTVLYCTVLKGDSRLDDFDDDDDDEVKVRNQDDETHVLVILVTITVVGSIGCYFQHGSIK